MKYTICKLWRPFAWALTLMGVAGTLSAQTVTTVGGGNTTTPYSGSVDGPYARFAQPSGLAMDPAGNVLFIADYSNNVVRFMTNPASSSRQTYTFTNSSNTNVTRGISHPISVAVDAATNVYVLNQGSGTNGTILEFNFNAAAPFNPTFVMTNASRLTNATAMAMDGLNNIFVTVHSNTVLLITPPNTVSVVGVITNPGVNLQGIAVLDNGQLALSDAGTNSGIWLMNPYSSNPSNVTPLAGFNGSGDNPNGWFGFAANAIFNHPANLAKAGKGILVVTDNGNHRVKLLDTVTGTVSLLYGVQSNLWASGVTFLINGAQYTDPGGWLDGLSGTQKYYAESRLPFGAVVAPDGSVYVSEDYCHVIRHVTATSLSAPKLGYPPLFRNPAGIALDSAGAKLYIADLTNNAVELLDLANNQTTTYLNATDGITNPASVLLDGSDNLYVLNQNTGTNGYILEFDSNQNAYGAIATGFNQPTAFTMDGNGNLFVAEMGGTIKAFVFSSDTIIPITTVVTNAQATNSVQLQGIAILDNGNLAVSDAGNHVIWSVNPITRVSSRLTGQLDNPGSAVGTNRFAQLNQPHQLARSGSSLLVADYGNNRLALVSSTGYLSTNSFNSSTATLWFGNANDPITNSSATPMIAPSGIAMSSVGGVVYVSEPVSQDIRGLTTTNAAGPNPAPIVVLPFYGQPAGIALNSAGTSLFVADSANNQVDVLNLVNNLTTIYSPATNLATPVDVAVDSSDNLYVLNQGTGASNGYILEFNKYGNLIKTNASGLTNPAAMTLDTTGDIYIAEAFSGRVLMHALGSSSNTLIATINTNAYVQLGGIALLDDGTITVSDTGNDVIWQINAISKTVSLFTGQIRLPGKVLGVPSSAKLNQPTRLIRAAGNLLIAADSGNNQIVTIDSTGTITSSLISTNGSIWFGVTGDPFSAGYVPMGLPNGLALGSGGALFVSEAACKDIREIIGTGLNQLGIGGGGGTGTNAVIIAPTISPNSGYYPMGQDILINSPNPMVYYTTDGTDPTTNSKLVTMSGNIGHIHWFNTTNDLTFLRVKAFVGATNASSTVSGQPVAINTIGVPPDFNPMIQAGIGSSIVIPVVCNLGTNQQIKSYQFRCEIYPINNPLNTPAIMPLSMFPTNDFVPVVTPIQNDLAGSFSGASYSLGITNGLEISTAITNGNNGNTSFKNYAVVLMLKVQIPYAANVGDTYGVNILYPSATSDGYNANVPLSPMAPATIVVANIPYTVGDSASANGDWYNAGTFGDGNLDNSDVNQAFYASSGLRTPYPFTDVFNAMDVYPPDGNGYAGGDGQIRFLDWQTILERSLRLDLNDWSRVWTNGGFLFDFTTNLIIPKVAKMAVASKSSKVQSITAPWYRQALVGGSSIGNASPGSTVNVPVYVKLQNGSTVSGLQFRTVVTAQNGAPDISSSPQLYLASGVTSPYLQKSFKTTETAFGWQLGSFGYQSRSSNFLGWVSFTIPNTALSGQSYTVSFANADGSPDLNTQYNFESRSATVTVSAAAPAASICSDEWKLHFFGSTTNPAAADNADPDGDGVPNWMEFLAGTDPTNAQSKLQLSLSGLPTGTNAQVNWLTAPGHAYELQSSASLAGGWITIATVSGSGTVTNLSDTKLTGAARYYRLHILP